MPPSLDIRGQIAAAELAFYVPIVLITTLLVFRYGLSRDAGWIFLWLFGLARIASGALIVAAETTTKNNIDLLIAAYTLFPAALGLLMLATIGFIGLAGQHTYSEYLRTTYLFRFLGFIALIGIALSIAGELLGTHVSPNAKIGLILRRVAAGVYAGLYVALIFSHFWCLFHRFEMRSYRRRLLHGCFFALLPLGVRVAYQVLDAWSASDQFGTQLSSNPTLAQFNSISGKWLFYLVMGLIMEFVASIIYLVSSTILFRKQRRY